MKIAAATIALLTISTASAFGVTGSARNGRPSTVLNIDAAALDPGVLAAGGAILAGLVGAVATQGGKGESAASAVVVEEEVVKIDVSIPYDAAARLAFKAAGLNEGKYGEFQPLYNAKSVADVTVKKVARELALLEAAAAKKAEALESL